MRFEKLFINFLFPGKDKKKMKKVVRELSVDSVRWLRLVFDCFIYVCQKLWKGSWRDRQVWAWKIFKLHSLSLMLLYCVSLPLWVLSILYESIKKSKRLNGRKFHNYIKYYSICLTGVKYMTIKTFSMLL